MLSDLFFYLKTGEIKYNFIGFIYFNSTRMLDSLDLSYRDHSSFSSTSFYDFGTKLSPKKHIEMHIHLTTRHKNLV